jgi:hypothetical protein
MEMSGKTRGERDNSKRKPLEKARMFILLGESAVWGGDRNSINPSLYLFEPRHI